MSPSPVQNAPRPRPHERSACLPSALNPQEAPAPLPQCAADVAGRRGSEALALLYQAGIDMVIGQYAASAEMIRRARGLLDPLVAHDAANIDWKGTALIASKGVANVPSGALIAMSTILLALGIPGEAVALVAGVDVFLDMGRTAMNVFGNTLSVLVARRLGEGPAQEPVAGLNPS